ncbi:RHS repeat protein [Rhizobacter sp. J219]|uniref:RHS repeat protein n=1 Tax=Rhizobacter sp. J219 TaxID=2898430 RepID=UPI002151CED4|nr:RHS repeat protein [Rhizobacter sp. J219]MCR5881401.1 RHS repeat protein [Rhizobacter sp. J219]
MEGEGITGAISWNNVCPTYPYFRVVVNQISGSGTDGDPRVFKNRCERTVTRVLPAECGLGNPIYPASGTKRQSERDYGSASGLLTFTRHYNSTHGRFRHEYEPDFAGPTAELSSGCVAGEVWWGSPAVKFASCFPLLNVAPTVAQALFTGPDGVRDELAWDGTSGQSLAPHLKNSLIRINYNGSPAWLMTRPEERRLLVFDEGGRLQKVQRVDGASVSLTYSNGQLATVKDDWDRTLRFAQDSNGISGLTDPAGVQTTYNYSNQKLTTVRYPDGGLRTYVWNEPELSTGSVSVNRLTGIVDEAQRRFASFGYRDGKAVSTEYAGGVNRFSIADARTSGRGAVSLTYPSGSVHTTTYELVNGFSRVVASTQPAGSGCTASTSNISYDANGNVASKDDFNRTRTCYVHDPNRNVETTKVEGLSNAVACGNVTPLNAALPANGRKTSTAWHPDWRLETRVAEPGRIVTSVYNGQPDPFAGGAVASCAPTGALLPDGKPIAVLCKRVEQATTDANGAAGFAAVLQSGVPARTTTWTYNQWGQVLTENGPRTDVNDTTTYSYYSDTSFTGEGAAAEGHFMGDLQTVTNPADRVTRYTKYNKHGQVLESVDPNGVLTTHTYDLRQRLLSTTVGGRTTSYQYDPVGQLKRVTLPDQSWVGYDYDDAHRQVAVYDHKGNRIDYVLDNAGNRIGENTRDPGGALKRQLVRSIDALGRVQQTIGRE